MNCVAGDIVTISATFHLAASVRSFGGLAGPKLIHIMRASHPTLEETGS